MRIHTRLARLEQFINRRSSIHEDADRAAFRRLFMSDSRCYELACQLADQIEALTPPSFPDPYPGPYCGSHPDPQHPDRTFTDLLLENQAIKTIVNQFEIRWQELRIE